jgi:hypothetical protein
MADPVEELLEEIRAFRHQYQRFYMFAVPKAGAAAITALRRIAQLTKIVEMEISATVRVKKHPQLISSLDELLHIVLKREKTQKNSAGD